MKNKNNHPKKSMLSLFGSLPPKGSSVPKEWNEIRKETCEQYSLEKVSIRTQENNLHKQEKRRD